MALHEGGGGGGRNINYNLVIKDDGAKKVVDRMAKSIVSVFKSMEDTIDGMDMAKYWDSAKSSIDGVLESLNNFNSSTSKLDAEEYRKRLNAFIASGGDISELEEKFGSTFDNISKRAKGMSGEIADEFSVDRFKEAFAAFEHFSELGVDINKIFSALDSGSYDALNEQLASMSTECDSLRTSLEQVRGELESTREKVKNLESGAVFEEYEGQLRTLKSRIEELEEQNEDLEGSFSSVTEKAEKEFRAFLAINEIPDKESDGWTERYPMILDQIREGFLSGKEAIAEFKRVFNEDWENSAGFIKGSLGGLSQEDMMTLRRSISEVKEELAGMISSMGQFAGNSATVALDINNFISQMREISDDYDATETIDTVARSLRNLIDSLHALAGDYGGDNFSAISDVLTTLKSFDSVSVNEEAIDTIVAGLSRLSEIGDVGKLSVISNIDFSRYADLHVTKTSLSNLYTYLSQLSQLDIGKLAAISQLDFSSLANLKISSTLGESLIAVAKAVAEIGSSTSVDSGGFKDLVTQLSSLSGAKVSKTNVDNLSSLLTLLSSFKSLSSLADLSGLDFSGINSLKVDGNSLNNLATYLPIINDLNIDGIRAITELDWANFANIDIEAEKLENLMKVLEGLSKASVVIVKTQQKAKEAAPAAPVASDEGEASTLVEDTDEYNRALSQVDKALVSARENLRKWDAAIGTEGFTSLQGAVADLEDLRTNLEGFTNSEFKSTLISIKADIDEAINSMSEDNLRFGAFANDKAWNDLETQIRSRIQSLQTEIAKWGSSIDDATLEPLRAMVSRYQGILSSLESGRDGGVEFFAAFGSAVSEANARTKELESTISEIFNNGGNKTMVEGADDYNKALSELDKTIIRVRDDLSNWSAAGVAGSATEDDYKRLQETLSILEDLKANLSTFTAEGFKSAMSIIKSDIDSVAESLSKANADFNKTANDTSWNKFATNVQSSIRSIQNSISTWGKVLTPAQLQPLRDAIAEYQSLYSNIITKKGRGDAVDNDILNKVSDLNQRTAQLKTTTSELYNVNKETFSPTLVAGTTEYNKALTKINALIVKISENSAKWTAARSGSTSSNYDAYVDQANALRILEGELKSGSITYDEFNKRVSEVESRMRENEAAIKLAGEATASFSSKVMKAVGDMTRYMSAARIIFAAIRTFKDMVKTSIEIESSMARIQIVTGATDRQMTSFFESASAQAKELGKSITDVAGSIETFSRLGYSLTDATELSKYATIMSNVADTSVDEATTGLTSIIKGFDMQASDAEHVSDVLIQVGQKYAISAEELMVAFERGGAALNASGTSFEKSAALFAATNASLQNAATTGTLWKTVSARIRGATTELEEMGEETDGLAEGLSKYREEILALSGVDIMIDEHTYKDMYDIFVELASVWDNITSDTSRSRIAEILGGTRQLSGIASTIQNIADAQNAYNDALSASGVSESANAIYMETTQAHIEQLSASYQELAADIFNSDFLKFFVDLGKGIVDVIDKIIDSIGVFGTIFASVFVTAVVTGVANIVSALGGMSGTLTMLFARDFAPIMTVLNALYPFAPVILGIAAAAGVAFVAINTYLDKTVRAIDNAIDKADESRNAFEKASSDLQGAELDLQSIQNKIDEINSRGGITLVDEEELRKLELAKSAAEATVKLLQEAESESRKQAAEDARDALTTTGTWRSNSFTSEGMSASSGRYGILGIESGTILDKASSYKKSILELEDEQKQLNEEINNGTIAEEDLADAGKRLDEISDRLGPLREEYADMVSQISELYSSLLNEDGSVLPGFEETASAVENFLNTISSVSDKTVRFKDTIGDIIGANVEEGTRRYEEAIKKMESLGFDPNQTVFGNIDANNRQVLQWTDDMIAKYSSAIESFGESAENLKGSFSTIFGMSRDYGGVEIAFSPMLQTDDGPVLLDSDTVDEYIWGLIKEAGDKWSTEDLLKLDAKGLTVSGRKINKLIADVGETAIATGEAMHYAGDLGELGDAIKQIDDANKLATMSAEDFINAYGSNDTINDIVEEAIALGIVADDSNGELGKLASSLFDVGIIGAGTADELAGTALTIEQLSKKIDEFSEFQDKLTGAMDASKSATGLTTEQVNDLKNAYKNLEGFNPARLFETTYNGIHLNEEELRRLNEEAADHKLADLYTTLASKLEEYYDIKAKGGDTRQIRDEIYDTELLISQYEGLTSAYNTYLSAKSGKKERDSYEGIGADYEEMKKILDMGWYGDDSLNSYLDLILSKAARTGDAVKDFERLNKTIEGTSHSILDYWQYDENSKELASDGLFSFLKDVNKKFGDTYASVEDGNYVFDLTGNKLNEVADAFGMSAEMIQIFERALIDTGSVVVLDNDKIEEITGSLKDLQNAGEISPDIDLNFDLAEMSLEDIQSKIKELNEAKAKINVETDEDGTRKLQLLDAAVSALQNKAVSLKINTAIENGATVEELMNMDDETLKSTLNIEVNGDTELQQAMDMLQTLSSGTSVPITVKIDESQFSALTNSGSEATIVYHVNRTEVDAFIEESHDDDATVTYGVDRSLVDAFRQSNINRTATVTYTADTSKLPTTFTRLKRYIDYVHVGEASGTMRSVKTARANGSMYNAPLNYKRAFANGSVALDEDELALVNELGTESIILFVTLYSDVYRTIYLIAGNSLEPNMLQHNYEI